MIKKFIFFLTIFLTFLGQGSHFASAVDITQEDRNSVINGSEFYSVLSECSSSVPSTDPSGLLSADELAKINALKDQYVAVANEKGIAWQYLATVHRNEGGNNPNQSLLDGSPIPGPNNDHPGLYITSLQQSMELAADYLKGLAKSVYNIDVGTNNTLDQVKYIFLAYGRGSIYKNANVPADQYPIGMNDFDAAHHNMVFPSISGETLAGRVFTRVGEVRVFGILGGFDGIGGITSTAPTCLSGGIGVDPTGFVFPQKTTKAAIKNPQSSVKWCWDSQQSCHHDYNAADIGNATGTPVLAPRDGVVLQAHNQGSIGDSVRMRGSDGYFYYFAHMGYNSRTVQDGNQVKAGQVLGYVGTAADAQNTGPHTHFDICPPGCPQSSGFNRPGPLASNLINPQPVLIAAFNNLPDN